MIFGPEERITDFWTIPRSDHLLVELSDTSLIEIRPDWKVDSGAIGKIERFFNLEASPIYAKTMSPSGRYLLLSFMNNRCHLIDMQTEKVNIIRNHFDPVVFATFSLDEQFVLLGGRDNKATVWEVESGAIKSELIGHEGNVYGGGFALENKWIWTRSFDGSIRLWELDGRPKGNPLKHQNYVHDAFIARGMEGIISCSADGTIDSWDLEDHSAENLHQYQDVIFELQPIPENDLLLGFALDGTVILSELKGGLNKNIGLTSKMESMVIPKSNKELLVGLGDGRLGIIDLNQPNDTLMILAHRNSVYDLSYIDELDLMLSTSYDGTSKLWTPNNKLWFTIDLGANERVASKFSEDQKGVYSLIGNNLSYCPLPSLVYDQEKEAYNSNRQ